MLISLPVEINSKHVNIVYQIIYEDTTITVKPYNNNNNFYNIILCSELYGINKIPISFPLTFYIVKEVLLCDLYFILKILSGKNDFISILLNGINTHYNKKFTLFNNINNILSIKLTNLEDILEYSNIDDMINKVYYRTNKFLNFCLTLMYNTPLQNYSDSINSKTLSIINSIKQIKIMFYGNNMTVNEHIEHINDRKLIKKKKYYYFSNSIKTIRLCVNSINDTHIICDNTGTLLPLDRNKYIISAYPNKFTNNIKIQSLIVQLVLYHYATMIEIVGSIIYKKKSYNKLINGYYCKNNINDKLIIIKEIRNYVKVIEDKYIDYIDEIPNNISFNKFKEIILTKNDFDLNILEKLFNNYIYSFNYDKRTLNPQFAKILFYSFKHYNNILELEHIKFINIKIKSIYLFILKVYKSIDMNNFTFFYNSRIYTDYVINNIIKILLFNDTYNLIGKNANTILLNNIFINSTIIINILNNINWKTISKQLNCFKYILSMKDQYSDLFIVDGKINKNINPTMDYRLKRIILDPLQMFNYLKKESDYYKWLINIRDDINKIFNNVIILKDSDIIKLSRTLYLLSKVTTQSIDDIEYKKLINFLQRNTHIILFNNRINIKIKDIFKNSNINLGFLAKHIVEDNNSTITITDEVYSHDDLSYKLTKMTKQYYKYKGKYIEIKSHLKIHKNI